MEAFIYAAIAFIAVVICYMILVNVFSTDKKSDSLRVFEQEGEHYDTGLDGEDLVDIERPTSGGSAFTQGLLGAFGIDVKSGIKEWQDKAAHAGITDPDKPSSLLLYKKLIGPIIGIVGLAIMAAEILNNGFGGDLLNLVLGIIFIFLGFYGVDIYIKNVTQKRQTVLLRSFPDALDLIVVCVESGLALDGALTRVCKELGRAHPEITKELNQTRIELALLNDRPKALMNLGDRTGLVPFRSLVAALIQTEKFGTSLTDTLRVLSEDYRLTRLMLAEQKAGRLPVLMTIPLILLLMPAFVLIILAPPFIRVSQQGGLFGNG